ncbi:hypothetical protein Tco_0818183 [Tanacetum coccineum]
MGVPLFKLGLKGNLNFPMIHHSEEGSSFGNRLKADKEEIYQDVNVTLVTPTKVDSQEDQPEDQLGVLSAAKELADATRVHTYSRRKRAVSTGSGGVSTASRIVSTVGMIQQVNIIIPSSSATKDKGKAIMTESEPEQTTTKLKQGQERVGYEAAIRLQEHFNEEESQRITKDAKIAQRLQEEIDVVEKQRMAQIGEGLEPAEESRDELSQEQLQQLMIIVPEERMNVEALQTNYNELNLQKKRNLLVFEHSYQKLFKRSNTLSWKSCQGSSLNLPDHRGGGFSLVSNGWRRLSSRVVNYHIPAEREEKESFNAHNCSYYKLKDIFEASSNGLLEGNEESSEHIKIQIRFHFQHLINNIFL